MKATASMEDRVEATGRGEHQNIGRATVVLAALAGASDKGLRLTDVATATGLGKATVHRLLTGLVANGWVEQDSESGSFFLGLQLLRWAVAAGNRFGLAQVSAPVLSQLAESTQDTVYLSIRSGSEAVCIARHEGAFPIKTLTLKVGDRRPLGIGAGSLALLSFLPSAVIDTLLKENRAARKPYPLNERQLRRMIDAARENGYALNNEWIIQGLMAIGVPIFRTNGEPVAAISVAAIPSRLEGARLKSVVAAAKDAAAAIQKRASAVLDATVFGSVAR